MSTEEKTKTNHFCPKNIVIGLLNKCFAFYLPQAYRVVDLTSSKHFIEREPGNQEIFQ